MSYLKTYYNDIKVISKRDFGVIAEVFFLCENIIRKERGKMYNNFLPQQNPYLERLNNYMQAPQYQPQMLQQQQQNGLIRVTGLDGAKAFQMPANSIVALFDGSEDIFYIKQTDGAGFPTIRTFEFKERQSVAPKQDTSEFVTRQEFNETINKFMEVLSNGKQSISTEQQSTNE